MYAPVDTLPDSIRKALQSVRYGRRDISIEATERTSLSEAGSAGQKAFVILVNLDSGQTKTTWGSWGGPNMFNPRNPVDLDTREYPIPDNGAVIQGSVGNSTYARVLISPSTIAPYSRRPIRCPTTRPGFSTATSQSRAANPEGTSSRGSFGSIPD